MTQEEKQLLIKDLRERLPYSIKCNVGNIIVTLEDITEDGEAFADGSSFDAYDMKPYLRPMDNMTIVEKNLYDELYKRLGRGVSYEMFMDFIDTHHLDWLGLIEKGLALPAPFGMYKTE